MEKELKSVKHDIRSIKNSLETIQDSNCIFILKHLMVVIDNIVMILEKSTKTNICKYCHTNKTYSDDPDVLCEDCKETFGHSFYHEL